jgi:hypothetical protein
VGADPANQLGAHRKKRTALCGSGRHQANSQLLLRIRYSSSANQAYPWCKGTSQSQSPPPRSVSSLYGSLSWGGSEHLQRTSRSPEQRRVRTLFAGGGGPAALVIMLRLQQRCGTYAFGRSMSNRSAPASSVTGGSPAGKGCSSPCARVV